MARRPVPPDLADWEPTAHLVACIAALLPYTCDAKTPGAPWLATADVLARVANLATAAEARVAEASEHVGCYYLTIEGDGEPSDAGCRTSGV